MAVQASAMSLYSPARPQRTVPRRRRHLRRRPSRRGIETVSFHSPYERKNDTKQEVLTQHGELSEVRRYQLPRAFWAALLEVRNYWMLERRFGDHIYCATSLDSSLRRAFDLMGDHLLVVMMVRKNLSSVKGAILLFFFCCCLHQKARLFPRAAELRR